MARSKKTTREPSKMVRVDEAMEILSVSKSTAYHTIQKSNKNLPSDFLKLSKIERNNV